MTVRATRPSTLEWLDSLPLDWDERELGRETWVRARLGWKGLTAEEYVDDGIPLLATPDIKQAKIDFERANKISAERYEESPEIMLSNGDVLLTKDGSTIGTVNVVRDLPGPATVNGSIAVLTPIGDLDGRYLYWFIASRYAQATFDRLRGGMGVPHLFQRDINRIRIPFPPKSEQRAVADFLDRETAQIDTLIAEQQRLTDLLTERRASLVDAVLTYGPNRDSETIPTTNPWLPRLPADWRAISVRRVLSFGPANGVSPASSGTEDLVRSLSIGAVRHGRVSCSVDVTKLVDRAKISDVDELRLRPGDILLVRGNGNVDLVARAGLVGSEFEDNEYIYPDLLIRVRTSAAMRPDFFVWACNATATRVQVRALARTAVGTFKVSGGDVRSLTLPLPPLHQQSQIVAYLGEHTAKINAVIAESERLIELARERRAALITAAVTGQIDVSGAAA